MSGLKVLSYIITARPTGFTAILTVMHGCTSMTAVILYKQMFQKCIINGINVWHGP